MSERKVFLDLGANAGQSVDLFVESYEGSQGYEIYCFEPSAGNGGVNQKRLKARQRKYKKTNKIFYSQKIVWVFDGKVKFANKNNESSTIMPARQNFNKNRVEERRCINFSKWLAKNFDRDDYIVLKMDIEGAEYDVLEQMFETGVIEYINEFYVDWHWMKMRPRFQWQERHESMIDKLIKIDLLPYGWGTEMHLTHPKIAYGARGKGKYKNYDPYGGIEEIRLAWEPEE